MSDQAEDKPETKGEEGMEESTVEEKAADNAVEEKPEETKKDEEESKAEESKEKVEKQKEEAEEEEESEEETPKKGLLEQPIVLEEGRKRERKKVERMTFQSPDPDKEKVEIKQGKGTSLGEIPIIEHRLNRVKVEDAKPLHRILFRRIGTAQEVKKNIRKFSGFPFGKGDPEFEKRMQILKSKTFTKSIISNICETLDVPRSGSKDEVTERLMEWLLKPEDSGRKVPKKRKKATPKGKKTVIKIKGKPKKTKAKSSDDDDDDDDDDKDDDDKDDDSSDDDSDESESSSDTDAEEPVKKKKKTEKKEKKPKEKKEPVKKTETKKKTPAKKKVSDDEVSDISSDSDDDKPIMKPKEKGPPTNDELKEVIKKMLDSANLEEVTMKSVLKEIYAKYPDHDLADRKEFVKNTVKQIIS